MERFRFYSREQKESESVDQYISALHCLAITCKLETMSYDQVLRDQILMKTKSKKIQEKLWSSGDLTLNKALEIARSIEQSELCVQAVRKDSVPPVCVVTKSAPSQKTNYRVSTNMRRKISCYRCGSTDHLAISKGCPAVSKVCNICKKRAILVRCVKVLGKKSIVY